MTELITSRRSFLTGFGAALITAPAIVRAGSLMPVKRLPLTLQGVPIEFDPPGPTVFFQNRIYLILNEKPE